MIVSSQERLVMCVDFMQRQQTVNTKTRCEKEKASSFFIKQKMR
ncbi:hypothetical protein CYQ13_03430 [Enterococcus faecalis]|nr:hypothetical protein CYQ13_03430 [Enterococcus faecalis]